MVNAQKVAASFIGMLPHDSWCPEATSGYEGFVHPVQTSGGLEEARVQFIVRDFDTKQLDIYEARLEELARKTAETFPGSRYEIKVTEQYRNMKEMLDKFPNVMNYAEEAYKCSDLITHRMNVRGGTDGSRLSFMGLPCPNIFTGEMGIHSKMEYVSVQDMEKSVEVLVNLVQVWEEKA